MKRAGWIALCLAPYLLQSMPVAAKEKAAPAELTLLGSVDRVEEVAFSPDGKLLASRDEFTVKIWDLAAGTLARTLTWTQGDRVHAIAFAPDGTLAVASNQAAKDGGEAIFLGDAHSGEVKSTVSMPKNSLHASSLDFSPDSRSLAGGGHGVFVVFDVEAATIRFSSKALGNHNAHVAFSPDGKFLAAGGFRKLVILDAAGGAVVKELETRGDKVTSLEWAPDGLVLFLVAGDTRGAYAFDTQTWQEKRVFTSNSDRVTRAAASPDGKMLLTGGSSGSFNLWDLVTGKSMKSVMLKSSAMSVATPAVLAAAISPTGKFLATGGWDGIKLFDAKGEVLASFLTWPPESKRKPTPWIGFTPAFHYGGEAFENNLRWKSGGNLLDASTHAKTHHKPDAVKKALK